MITLLVGFTLYLCLGTSPLIGAEQTIGIQFEDVTNQTGITFTHSDGGKGGRRYIVESVASGVATLDYNNDGRTDILFLNGAPLPGSPPETSPARNALYRNDGNWKFTDVTERAGLTDGSYHLGICSGDYNNDGHPDLFLSNFGPDRLYRNNGDGTFEDVTNEAGVSNGNKVGAGAAFLDYDADGLLDLFVANYCDFTIKKHQARHINGYPAYVGPMLYGPTPDTLYHNNGDGTFSDVSASSNIANLPGTGMGVICADYDDDADMDIIVGNDAMANFVWQNDGKGKFKEVGLLSGLAYDGQGVGLGTMGIECGDYNNDGRLDFFMTSYQRQWTILYRNEGGGFFTDVTHISGAGNGSYNEVTWGLGMVDFDNDGYRDLFTACGHLQDNIQHWDDTARYESKNLLLRNTGKAGFKNISDQAGKGFMTKYSSRGAAFDDLDNDGDTDIVVLNARATPTLLRNVTQNKHHWVKIKLRGLHANRDGIGARVRVVSGDLNQFDEVRSGRGYQSHYGKILHFGLGDKAQMDYLEVRWPNGTLQKVVKPGIDQQLEIVETSPPQ